MGQVQQTRNNKLNSCVKALEGNPRKAGAAHTRLRSAQGRGSAFGSAAYGWLTTQHPQASTLSVLLTWLRPCLPSEAPPQASPRAPSSSPAALRAGRSVSWVPGS